MYKHLLLHHIVVTFAVTMMESKFPHLCKNGYQYMRCVVVKRNISILVNLSYLRLKLLKYYERK